jgi:NAD(P)-dependent dehydrogenase (short-subunit alcohol dehydrogenase family)
MKDFRNKVAVITGAGSGIGRATALALAREGARLHVSDIDRERIEAVAQEIRALGAEATAYVVDSSDRGAVEKFAAEVYANAGRVDILHNNAGIGAACPFEQISLEHWEKVINLNLWGAIYGLHFFLPRMIAQGGGGHVINTSSGLGLIGAPLMAAYTTTKFALVGLSEVMNLDLVKHGINTTVVCPGIIHTNIIRATVFDRMAETTPGKARDQVENIYARFGVGPEVVARDILKGVRKNRPVVVTPWHQMWPAWLLKRLSVRLYQFGARLIADKVTAKLGT